MANIIFGPVITGARGSIGAVTFSNSRSGPTARRRQKPVFPRTVLQGQRNAALGVVAQRWRDTLTPTNRTNWATLALATNFTNSLGQTYQIQPNALYIRSAAALEMGGVTWDNTAPLAATEVAPDLTLDTGAAGTIRVATWPNLVTSPNGGLLVFLSAVVTASQTRIPTSYTLQSFIPVGSFTALPFIILQPPVTVSGAHYFVRFTVVRTGQGGGEPTQARRGQLSFEHFADVTTA